MKKDKNAPKHFRDEIRRALNEDWYYVNRNKILDSRVIVYTFTPIKNALSLFILDLGMFLIVMTLIAYISVLGASRVARSKTAVIDEIIEESYNIMLESLKEQIERNNQIARETVLSEIKQLESQFNLHFGWSMC